MHLLIFFRIDGTLSGCLSGNHVRIADCSWFVVFVSSSWLSIFFTAGSFFTIVTFWIWLPCRQLCCAACDAVSLNLYFCRCDYASGVPGMNMTLCCRKGLSDRDFFGFLRACGWQWAVGAIVESCCWSMSQTLGTLQGHVCWRRVCGSWLLLLRSWLLTSFVS